MIKPNSIICGDCLEIMKDIPDKSIDLVLTDPPYGINYKGSVGSIENDKDLDWLKDFFKQINRVLKDNTNLYIYTSIKHSDIFIREFKKHFDFKNLLINKQTHSSGIYNPYAFRNSYELIIFGQKGKRKLNQIKLHKNKYYNKDKRCKSEYKLIYDDWIDFIKSAETNNKLLHPTQKNVEIMSFFIRLSSNENDTILDPFIGSGTTAVACQELHRNFIGIEISEKYCEIARDRLKQKPLF